MSILLAIYFISAFMLFLAYRFEPSVVKFSLKPYLKFVFFLSLITIIRLVVFSIAQPDFTDSIIHLIPFWTLFMVWWEDVVFVLPILLMVKKNKSKLMITLATVLSSVLFGLGHLYQGEVWALITTAYVPIMLYYARKYGILTTAGCHITYDVVTYLTLYLWMTFA